MLHIPPTSLSDTKELDPRPLTNSEPSPLSRLNRRPEPRLDIQNMAPDSLVHVEPAHNSILPGRQLIRTLGDLAHKGLELGTRPVGDELVAERAAVQVA